MRIFEAVKEWWNSAMQGWKSDWNSDWSIPTARLYPLCDWNEVEECYWPESYIEEKRLKEQKLSRKGA